MTSEGGAGTAADCQPGGETAGSCIRGGWFIEFDDGFIKCDDGRLAARYIDLAYSHTPAGAAPNSLRRERQVASALRNCTDFLMTSLICGAEGITVPAGAGPCLRARSAPTEAAPGGDRLERPPRRLAKGSR
jgi:hypothetical protein